MFHSKTGETKPLHKCPQTHTEKGGNIIWRLVEHEVELCISLVHLISFKQTKAGSSQQVILDKKKNSDTFIFVKYEELDYLKYSLAMP